MGSLAARVSRATRYTFVLSSFGKEHTGRDLEICTPAVPYPGAFPLNIVYDLTLPPWLVQNSCLPPSVDELPLRSLAAASAELKALEKQKRPKNRAAVSFGTSMAAGLLSLLWRWIALDCPAFCFEVSCTEYYADISRCHSDAFIHEISRSKSEILTLSERKLGCK